MSDIKAPLKLKIKDSLKSVSKVLSKPTYVLLSLLTTLITSGLILWSLNLGLLKYVLFEAQIGLSIKIDFFFEAYKSIFTNFSSEQGVGIIIFSILFGINIALLIFVLKNRGFNKIPKKSGAGGFALAIIGGGCVACGTSIIAPLVATFGAASAPFIRDIGTVLIWLGIILIIYSIYKLGSVCSYIYAKNDLTNV